MSFFSKRDFGAGRNLPAHYCRRRLVWVHWAAGARVVKRRIPGSVYKLNMVSKMVVGMKVDDALTQLNFAETQG